MEIYCITLFSIEIYKGKLSFLGVSKLDKTIGDRKMRKIIKRVLCLLVLVATLCYDAGYSVWAAETNYEQKQYEKDGKDSAGKREHIKDKYTEKEREQIINDAMKKINNGEEITDEEVEVINYQYDELEINLPVEEIEWDVDHEKGIGVNDASTYSLEVYRAVYQGVGTTVKDVGNMSTSITQKYNSGKGFIYDFLSYIRTSFVVPGMKQTGVVNKVCEYMIPQGIHFYGGYIFVTAYCSQKTHNSVIYVLDASTKTYITTLVMDEISHAGGITYANGYLWIADTKNSVGYISYYDYTKIDEAIKYVINWNANYPSNAITCVRLSYFTHGKENLGSGNLGSFVTTYNGYLCIGEFMEDSENTGELNLYNPKELINHTVNKHTATKLPANAQGATFYTTYNKTYLIINSSNGRYSDNHSYVHVYSAVYNSSSYKLSLSKSKEIQMPPMVEEAYNYNGQTYFVFESCGKKYREGTDDKPKAEIVIGKVCGFSTSFIYK